MLRYHHNLSPTQQLMKMNHPPPAPVLPKGSLELWPHIDPLQPVWVLVFHKVGPVFDQFFALLSLLTEATLDLLKLLSSFPFSMSIIITDTDDLMTHDGESTCPPPKSLQRSAKHEGEFWPVSSVMIPDQYQRDKLEKLVHNRCARCNLCNIYTTWHFDKTFTILLQYYYNTFTILLHYFYNTFAILL